MKNIKSPAEQKREQKERIDRGLEDFMEDNGFGTENNMVVPSLTPEEFKQMRANFREQSQAHSDAIQNFSGKRTILLSQTQEDCLLNWRRQLNLNQQPSTDCHIFSDEEIISLIISDLLPSIPIPTKANRMDDLKVFFQSLKIFIQTP